MLYTWRQYSWLKGEQYPCKKRMPMAGDATISPTALYAFNCTYMSGPTTQQSGHVTGTSRDLEYIEPRLRLP